MKKQLELFEPPQPEIPEKLKSLLLGNGENDFTTGIEIAKGLGLNLIECLELALCSFELEIPEYSQHKHFELRYSDVLFQIIEDEYNEIDFFLVVTTLDKQSEISLCGWGCDDDCEDMQKSLKRKIKTVIKDNYHYFKELLK